MIFFWLFLLFRFNENGWKSLNNLNHNSFRKLVRSTSIINLHQRSNQCIYKIMIILNMAPRCILFLSIPNWHWIVPALRSNGARLQGPRLRHAVHQLPRRRLLRHDSGLVHILHSGGIHQQSTLERLRRWLQHLRLLQRLLSKPLQWTRTGT